MAHWIYWTWLVVACAGTFLFLRTVAGRIELGEERLRRLETGEREARKMRSRAREEARIVEAELADRREIA